MGTFKTFERFNNLDVDTKKIPFPIPLESLDYNDINSEATAINCAFVSGILNDFIDDKILYPTVSGRMSSSSFDFKIDTNNMPFKIEVANSQIEIDGGYEGETSLTIIEAKNYISSDFLIRQLFYPYRLWSRKINKKVRTVFLTYSNGTFHLREYSFLDVNSYNSITLTKERKYVVYEGEINLENIQKIIDSTDIVQEPDIPFPQANSFERVINLCEILYQKGELTRDDLLSNYDFTKKEKLDKRQINYYTDAARYLGLVDKKLQDKQVTYFLSKEGLALFNLNIIDRQLKFVELILSHAIFKRTLQLYLDNSQAPLRKEIVPIMIELQLYNIGEHSTFFRRASTILAWTNWIMNLIEE
ncbi:hypothetical protein [Flavobacterium sp. J372]|uniref:DUF6997 domain-containing protein n=1 Tax=Flavobacterium sp. J372 TaxID=2898436 RepID=UPI0035B515A8